MRAVRVVRGAPGWLVVVYVHNKQGGCVTRRGKGRIKGLVL